MGKRKIAVIGAGISGLTLAYAVRQEGLFEVSVFTAKDAEDVRNGRIPSTQIHFDAFLRTEERYGIGGYGDIHEIKAIELLVAGQRMFKGKVPGRAINVDQREYIASLLEGLVQRGVDVRKRRIAAEDLPALAEAYDLIVDATGKLGPVAPFPIYEGMRAAPATPQRVCSAGLFQGLVPDEENKMSFHIVPGLGELFETATMTARGLARTLLFEPIPGSEMDLVRGDRGPERFAQEMLGALQAYFPSIYERVRVDEFRLVDPNAYMRVAIKPEVRVPYTTANGTIVLGCGDSVALNDPITGQGANAASYCADALYNVLVERADAAWDDSLGALYWSRIQEYIVKMSEWTNAMMGPPSPSFADLLARATRRQDVADEIVRLFTDPIGAHEAFFAAPKLEA